MKPYTVVSILHTTIYGFFIFQHTFLTYLEYYGFNSYDYMAQKVVGPDLTDYQQEFIPEFLNLDIITDVNGDNYPNIIVDILT